MIFPEADPKAWSLKFKIPMDERKCSGCNRFFPMNTPVALNGYRGLQMEAHGCSKLDRIYSPIGETKAQWDKAMYGY